MKSRCNIYSTDDSEESENTDSDFSGYTKQKEDRGTKVRIRLLAKC